MTQGYRACIYSIQGSRILSPYPASPLTNILHCWSMLVQNDELISIHYFNSRWGYITFDSALSGSLDFAKWVKCASTMSVSHWTVSLSWKPLVLLRFISLPFLEQHPSFYCLCSFGFSRKSCCWNRVVSVFLRLVLLTQPYGLRFLCVWSCSVFSLTIYIYFYFYVCPLHSELTKRVFVHSVFPLCAY